MPLPTAAYCTDEDLSIRLGADFTDVLPKDQVLAAGSDGVIAAGTPWLLASATADFAGQGVAAGMVALLTLPSVGPVPREQQLAVASADASGVTLRRKGQAAGMGQPPVVGGRTGIGFLVASAQPQLIRASYDLNRRFGVDDLVVGRRTSDLYDPAELVEATMLTAAWKLYANAARMAGTDASGGQADAYWAKSLQVKRDLDELLGRVAVHWLAPVPSPGGAGIAPATTRFGTRMSR